MALAAGLLARLALALALTLTLTLTPALLAQKPQATSPPSSKPQAAQPARDLPPRALAAERFLAARGVAPGHRALARSLSLHSRLAAASTRPTAARAEVTPDPASSSVTWTPLGPTAVSTSDFNLVTGRITSIAIDPSDTTGNHVYIGATGGGVWSSSNAGASTVSNIVFNPLTDAVTAFGSTQDASISIGAVTVQPGGTGVILAGTGDPNDVLDSYYGAGILRSTDGGNTWSLIAQSSDVQYGASMNFSFAGEGFAGFAWSTVNPMVVVAAVTGSYEGDVVDANLPQLNCEGLYYSTDSGATWRLATISDGSGKTVQSAATPLLGPNGNAATAVVWNPVRQLFIAAVRFHGYYTSPDGVTWTRLADADQPGGINSTLCPTNPEIPGDEGCPLYRGALAVNPTNGDTFAWTVDIDDQDQGLWQDQCVLSGSLCTNTSIIFGTQWNTGALETSTNGNASAIANGSYTLALAAVPSTMSSTGSLVLAGANDLWAATCPLSAGPGCSWRNTTNSTTCMSAGVGEFQHALAWNASNSQEIFIGNDSGLWRSTDAIAEGGAQCSSSDASHFQNLNGTLGSLAEVESLSLDPATPYALMAGLGVNGAAGVDSTTVTGDWPQILSGFGGPVAIDPTDSGNWYVNDAPGVAIYLGAPPVGGTPGAFHPVLNYTTDPDATTPLAPGTVAIADVVRDGLSMAEEPPYAPAAFLVDPLDSAELLIATCRVWRGPANGVGWGAANVISGILDGVTGQNDCAGNALIRSMAAMALPPSMALPAGGEVVYVGMYGSANGNTTLPGHVLSGVYNSSSGTATWSDLTRNPVTNASLALNYYGLDISSIVIDPHDTTGNTVYVTVEGMPNYTQNIDVVYRSTDGGSTWTSIVSNLPETPASSLAVDPQSTNTVYIATDAGVFYTSEVAQCAQHGVNCWAVFGTGLPGAPAVELSAASQTSSNQVLVAATYGRGIWQAPLLTAGTAMSAASVAPYALTFSSQTIDSTSSAQTVTLQNTGSIALAPTQIAFTGDFSESGDTCVNQSIAPGSRCTISAVFSPQTAGPLTGEMTVYANIYGGQISVDLNGTGTAGGAVTLTPASIGFGQIAENTVSTAESITVQNSGAAVSIGNLTVSSPFKIPLNGNACGTSSLAAGSNCAIQVEFAPTTTGSFTGLLTLTDGAGTQTVLLTGTALAPPTDIVSPTSLTFPATPEGQIYPPAGVQAPATTTVTITNIGGMPLTGISITVSGPFQESPNCNAQLAAGAVCTIDVVFAPKQLGVLTGTLTITDALKTQTVSLSGTGVAPPVFNVTPTSLTFSNQQPGVASAPQTLTIANAGSSPMANVGFALTGAGAAQYSIPASTNTCGAVLSAGANCTAQVVFTPSGTGAIAATLEVSSSTPGVAAFPVPLNGAGQLANGLTANPTLLTFPVVAVGQTSAAQSVTITNSTSDAIASLAVSTAAPFSVSQNGCTGSLAAGANCTVAVVFAPTVGGAASGSLTVSSNAVATPATVTLSGTGFDFTVAFVGASTKTVAAGQTANYTLVITPSGASGTFTFACGTLPTDALCLFSPNTETLNAGVQGNVEVEISTTSPQARLERPDSGRLRSGRPDLSRTLLLACGLLLLPFAIFRRRRIFLLALLFAVLACGVTSCTSSGDGGGGCIGSSCSQQGGGGTPAGTYTIPVTVTSTGISQTVNVTLTVD